MIMHELGLMNSMLKTAKNALEGQLRPEEKVTKLVLEVGELTGAVPAYLKTAYDSLKKDTIFENCELETIYMPGTVKCKECGETFAARKNNFTCPKCKGIDLSFVTGKELVIKEIIVEE